MVEKEIAEMFGFSGFALTLMGILFSTLSGWIGIWLKKNYKEVSETKKKMSDMNIEYKEFQLMFDREMMNRTAARRQEVANMKKEIMTDVKSSIKRLWNRIDENKSSLTGVIDRMTGSMSMYDEKLYDLEKRLQSDLISQNEYHRDLRKVKDDFYNELNEIQIQISGNNQISNNLDLAESMKKFIDINKKIAQYESKVSDHEEKLTLYEKRLKNYANKIDDNERENLERHTITKKIVARSVSEVREFKDEIKETVGEFQVKAIEKIGKMSSHGNDGSFNKGEKKSLDNKKKNGTIIIKD